MARASPMKRPYRHPRFLDSMETFEIFFSPVEQLSDIKNAPECARCLLDDQILPLIPEVSWPSHTLKTKHYVVLRQGESGGGTKRRLWERAAAK
jgi:hypothetical protein